MAPTTEKIGILSRVAKLIPHPCNTNQVNRNFRETQRALDDISNIEIIGNDNIDVTCTVDTATGNNQINLNFNPADPAISVSYDWILRDDASSTDVIDDGNIVDFAGGTGITTALTSSNGTKTLTITNTATVAEAKWAVCQDKWEVAATPLCTHISVKDCVDCEGNTITGAAFDVLLPEVSNRDPNLFGDGIAANSDVIAYIDAEDGTKVCISDYLDDKILTMKNWLGTEAAIPQGWAKMDGTANSLVNGGTALDLTTGGRFIRGKVGSTAVVSGDTTGSVNHSHGGGVVSQTVTIDNKAAFNTELTKSAVTVADHSGGDIAHTHAMVQAGVTGDYVGGTKRYFWASNDGGNPGWDETKSGGATKLEHTVTDGAGDTGHLHEVPVHTHTNTGHSHTINNDSHVPISHSVHWIERIDNSL